MHNVYLQVRKVLADAVDAGLILRNPAERAKPPRPTRPEITTWTVQGAGFLLFPRGTPNARTFAYFQNAFALLQMIIIYGWYLRICGRSSTQSQLLPRWKEVNQSI